MKIDKIIFYYPSRQTGGTQYLFKRSAEYLAENQDEYKIYYMDYQDGFSRRNIKSDKVLFLDYSEDNLLHIDDGSIIIAQLNMIGQYSRFLTFDKSKSAILFWCLHATNIRSNLTIRGNIFLVSKRKRRQIGKILHELSKIGVVKFMVYHSCFDIFKDLYYDTPVLEWLPNIIEQNENSKMPSFSRLESSVVRFCWLGRLDAEKARNIITYMNELESLCKNIPVRLSLIGLGPAKNMLQEKAKYYSYPIDFVGEKREQNLDLYIRNETEIGLASGTSALEFAIRGKPVIVDWVIDKVFDAGERSKYTLIHEDEDINTSIKDRLVRNSEATFITKVNQILADYEGKSKAEYIYAKQKTITSGCNKLIASVRAISSLEHKIVVPQIRKIEQICRTAERRRAVISWGYSIFKKVFK